MPARTFSSPTYRYGFQGQEKDDEIKGDGLSVNYKYRMHDPRVGRFFAVDPLASKYPMYSPYHFSSNQPIHAKELEGLESAWDLNHRDPSFQNLSPEGQEHVRNVQGAVGLAGFAGMVAPFIAYGGATYYGTTALLSSPSAVAVYNWTTRNSRAIGNWITTGVEFFTGAESGRLDAGDVVGKVKTISNSTGGSNLILGKAHIIQSYAEKLDNVYHMFKTGFGMGLTDLSPSNMMTKAMYDVVDNGGKLIFDLTDVSIDAAKKGFSNFDEALNASQISEWELSKILRDEDLYNNTIFHIDGVEKTAKDIGLELIQ